MEVKVTLIVARGKHAGREIPVPIPKFFIGRAEDCHLRVHSELVSRHHCVVIIEEGFVAVRDFQSKNGTFVNGQRIAPQVELKPGDLLQVGPMELQVRVEAAVAGKKAAAAATGEEEVGSRLGVAGKDVSSDDDTVTMCPADLAKARDAAAAEKAKEAGDT